MLYSAHCLLEISQIFLKSPNIENKRKEKKRRRIKESDWRRLHCVVFFPNNHFRKMHLKYGYFSEITYGYVRKSIFLSRLLVAGQDFMILANDWLREMNKKWLPKCVAYLPEKIKHSLNKLSHKFIQLFQYIDISK